MLDEMAPAARLALWRWAHAEIKSPAVMSEMLGRPLVAAEEKLAKAALELWLESNGLTIGDVAKWAYRTARPEAVVVPVVVS